MGGETRPARPPEADIRPFNTERGAKRKTKKKKKKRKRKKNTKKKRKE